MKKIAALSLLALGLAACAPTTFTNIDKNDDGSYTITRIRAGFFNVGSNVYRCTENAEGMTCRPLN